MIVSTGQHGHGHNHNHHTTMTSRRTPTRASFPPNPLSLSSSSYNQRDSQRQSLRVPLLDSPLPSPGLPSPSINNTPPSLRRHGNRPRRGRWKRRLFRLVLWLSGIAIIVWFSLSFLARSRQSPAPLDFMSPDGESYEIVGSNSLPEAPGPVIVTDKRGRARWTVSIPPNTPFPLDPAEYSRMCTESMDLARHLEDVASGGKQHAGHHGYYFEDPNYMDVQHAQDHGLLPQIEDDFSSASSIVGGETYIPPHAGSNLPICEKSLTFVLQTTDAGLAPSLLGLWTAYGLAQRENRAFFVDDTRWAYGAYTNYFQAPPMPTCRPPPAAQRVPCPHQARHLLVSAATTTWTFGHAFNNHFEDAHKMRVERQKPIFELARAGYDALFRLNGEDARYLDARIRSIRGGGQDSTKNDEKNDDSKKNQKSKGEDDPTIVGIHVRHGDRHPFEFQYRSSYIPLDTYVQAAEDILHSTSSPAPSSVFQPQSDSNSVILIASDDPDVYTSPEAAELIKAQRFISLASNNNNNNNNNGGSNANTHWEGGFFSALFWSLGAPENESRHRHGGSAGGPSPSQRLPDTNANSNSNQNRDNNLAYNSPENEDEQETEKDSRFNPAPMALHLRSLVARAYLLDMAVLGGASDAIVCGVSSASCRLLGVMIGWDAVVSSEGNGATKVPLWKNVDGSWGWKGIIW